jgi:hypothetical protein
LYQRTTSVVPKATAYEMGFSPRAQAMPRGGMTEKAPGFSPWNNEPKETTFSPEVLYQGTTSVVPKGDRL